MKIADLLLDLFGFAPPEPKPARPAPPKPAAPRRTAERSGPEVLEIARRSGGTWERVVFTSNRRIMASVANRGRDLRLNAAFAAAPDAVLVAVGELFAGRTA
ncbi:MAG: hypothetical protein ICV87_14385, partial [Gemmatimonadetes bacterium]|nr:hypothetical protein [Gemmatimonadota bacterium]